MLSDFQNLELFPVTVQEIIINMLVALFCGLIISFVYRITYRGPNYSVSFVNGLVLLTMITSIVLLVIGNNLARAFGLVGAMSIIRFRTAVRDTQDIVFIFFALSIGMAAGVGLLLVAVMGTIFVSIVILALVSFNWAHPRKREYLLQISYKASIEVENEITAMLRRYCKHVKLVNLKNIGYDEELEAFYHILPKKPEQSSELIQGLNQLESVYNINLYFDEDDANSPT